MCYHALIHSLNASDKLKERTKMFLKDLVNKCNELLDRNAAAELKIMRNGQECPAYVDYSGNHLVVSLDVNVVNHDGNIIMTHSDIPDFIKD